MLNSQSIKKAIKSTTILVASYAAMSAVMKFADRNHQK